MFIIAPHRSADNKKKWENDRRRLEHHLSHMGEYPFVLGMSDHDRSQVIKNVIKKRNRPVTSLMRSSRRRSRVLPHEKTKYRRNSSQDLPLMKKTLEPLRRPTTQSGARVMSATVPGNGSSLGLGETEDAMTANFAEIDADMLASLFELVDEDCDGLISRDEFLIAMSKNEAAMSFVERTASLRYLLVPSSWLEHFGPSGDSQLNAEKFGEFVASSRRVQLV